MNKRFREKKPSGKEEGEEEEKNLQFFSKKTNVAD